MSRVSRKNGFLNARGFTLIELLISLAIGMVILAALYKAYVLQDDVIRKQEGIMDASQNVRNSMDVLTRDLRMAGLGVPEDPSVGKITKAEYNILEFKTNYWNVSTELSSPASSAETTLNVLSETGFTPGAIVYLYGGINPYAISSIGTGQLNLGSGLLNSFPTGTPVNVVDTIKFNYGAPTNDLRRSINGAAAEIIANNIDYLEFSYFDANNNQMGDVNTALTGGELALVRNIKIFIVARSTEEENLPRTVTYNDGTTFTDGFVRKTLTSEVRLRNMF